MLLSLYLLDEMGCFQGGMPKDQDGKERPGHGFLWMDNRARLSAPAVAHGQDSHAGGLLSLLLRVWGTQKGLWEKTEYGLYVRQAIWFYI